MFHPYMIKVHVNNHLYSSFYPRSLYSLGTVSSSPDARPVDHKNKKKNLQLSSCTPGYVLQFSTSFFAKANSLYVMIYKWNKFLQSRCNSIELNDRKWTLLSSYSLDGNPPVQNLVWQFTIFEFSIKRYTWPCSWANWWTIVNNSEVSSFKSLVFKSWRR